jgi:hypothetical protein
MLRPLGKPAIGIYRRRWPSLVEVIDLDLTWEK